MGNAFLLATVTALHDYCDPDNCVDKFTKVDAIRGLMTLECMIIITCWGFYIKSVRAFNRTKSLPDCLNKDLMGEMMGEREEEMEGEEEPATVGAANTAAVVVGKLVRLNL